ncbi:MAG: stage III sporulation protein AE [Clostridia bacterium]|nr:stage III sporulation protein AE [Clostridia bacterium]
MKKFIIALVIALIMLMPCVLAEGDISPYLDGENLFNETVDSLTSGSFTLNPVELTRRFWEDFTREAQSSVKIVLNLMLISVLSSVVNVLSSSFGEKTSSEAAFFACFTLMSGLSLQCFMTALDYGAEVINTMTNFITKLSPAFMLMIAACGAPASAAAFRPVLSGAVYVISLLIKHTLMPLMTFGAVLGVAGNISDKVQITNFCRVVRSITKWLMAAVITIFTGISAIYGFSAPALDAMSTKAVKFAVGSLVPVVGGFLSDTLETVISGTRLMKNAVGTAGIVVLLSACVLPVIKIGVIQLVLRLASAVAEPVTDRRISRMLWDISEAVTTVFGVVIMTAVLFLINISIILLFTSGG